MGLRLRAAGGGGSEGAGSAAAPMAGRCPARPGIGLRGKAEARQLWAPSFFYRQLPGVAQLVARQLWELEAGSSSLPTRTIQRRAAIWRLASESFNRAERTPGLQTASPSGSGRRPGVSEAIRRSARPTLARPAGSSSLPTRTKYPAAGFCPPRGISSHGRLEKEASRSDRKAPGALITRRVRAGKRQRSRASLPTRTIKGL